MKKVKKPAPKKGRAARVGAILPKIYSIDTPYGNLTFLEGHGDNLDPAVVKLWEQEAPQLREERKRVKAEKNAKSNGKKKR